VIVIEQNVFGEVTPSQLQLKINGEELVISDEQNNDS
jgi:hypothetical protein